MRTGHPSKRMLIAGILSVAVGGCSNPGSGAARGGGAGGGTIGSGGSATAGTSDTAMSGGETGGAGPTGGGSGSGGQPDGGGQVGTGGQPLRGSGGAGAAGAVGSGGQAVGDTGGSGPMGGANAGGGQSASGGQAGRGAGGSGQTGGANATGGQSASGGQAGRGAGGTSAAGTTGTGGQLGSGGQVGSGSGGTGAAGATGTGGSGSAGGTSGSCGQLAAGQRMVSFGTLLDPQAVMCVARQLAKSLANPSSAQWRAKGDQHRTYHFSDANADEPYRLYVPTNWDGKSNLPLAMFLHGSGSDENTYVDQNNKQMLNLAQQHGYLLVAPLGDQGAYGNFLRLTSPFGDEADADKLMAQVTPDSERTNELSEEDVINVLELVLSEYPIDRGSMFLFGHSMGSGGTWYIGGKYADYWKGLAPMSGPFVQETGYPWDSVRKMAIFVTEGTQAPSLDGSRTLRDWLKANGFNAEYEEVNADHGGMIPLVLPDVFGFFDRSKS